MVFNSLHFIAFFAVVYTAYRLLGRVRDEGAKTAYQNWLLLAASYYFYGAWSWRFLLLLVGSTIVDFFCARFIAAREDPPKRRAALVVSLAFNLTILGFFKYFNFFAENTQALFSALGWRLDWFSLHVILPIGISFYTFMTMSYVIDVYRREIAPCPSFRDFALFVAFFPHLVAGPILRASVLLPQLRHPRRISNEQTRDGSWLIAWGMFKKIFVADNLSHVVDAAFGSASPTGLEVLLAVYAFALQIYADFSGYTDIARGVSKLMGIELNINFDYPYVATTPSEFWRRWHISLSTWLRDYLYIPLGGNRGSEWQTRRNLMITMVLGGLWHGAAWPFVIWGGYQGLLLVAYKDLPTRLKPRPTTEGIAADVGRDVRRDVGRGFSLVAPWLLMFHLTCFGWLIFRSRSLEQIVDLTGRLFSQWSVTPATAEVYLYPLLLSAVPFLALDIYQAKRGDPMAVFRLNPVSRYAIYGALFYLVLLFGDFGGAEFIYFQF